MSAPVSAARALYDVLNAVETIEAHSPYHAWQAVVGHDPGSPEFARIHTELMALLEQVSVDMKALEPSVQARYNVYFNDWWQALIRHREDWTTQNLSLIERSRLDMLAAFADVVENRALNLPDRHPQAAEILARSVGHILGEVKADIELPLLIRQQIIADLEHVLWLLSNVETYGLDRAIAMTENAVGRMATVVATTAKPSGPRRWMIGALTALSFMSFVAKSADEIVTHVSHIAEVISDKETTEDIVREAYERLAPKQIEQGASDPHSDVADVVDAELVDEP